MILDLFHIYQDSRSNQSSDWEENSEKTVKDLFKRKSKEIDWFSENLFEIVQKVIVSHKFQHSVRSKYFDAIF